jgi:hypothetical protein
LGAALFESALGVGQPPGPALAGGQRLGQRVPAAIPEALVFLGVDGIGLGERLACDLLVAAGRTLRRVGVDPRAVDGNHPDVDQTTLDAEAQDLAEHAGQRVPAALTKPRDRRVIRDPMGSDDAKGNVFLAGPLDRPRRPSPARAGVEQQRDHQRRLKRRAAVPVSGVSRVARGQVHVRNGVDDEPREVPLGQPPADVSRQQEPLLAVSRQEVLSHPRTVITAPDGDPALCNSHHGERQRVEPLRR